MKPLLGAVLLSLPTLSFATTPVPELNNKSYVLMDYATGQILAAKNEHQALAPASMTKMMTSFIVEQQLLKGELTEQEQVRVSQAAACVNRTESCMFLAADSRASVIDLLRGIIVQSGNDASQALAEYIAGDEAAFVQRMNEEAKRLGMHNTRFMNSTGMPAEGHYSSAQDMAILAQHIIQDSAKYYPIYAEKSFTFNNIQQNNRNALLFSDPSVDGLKTGHTQQAGYCLTTSAKRDNLRLISVIFGAPSMQARTAQTRSLLAWGYQNFEAVPVQAGKQVLQHSPVAFGKASKVNVGLAHDFLVTLPKAQKAKLETQMLLKSELMAPVTAGQVVGKMVVSIGGKTIAEQPLVALETIEQAGFFGRLFEHCKRFVLSLF